MEELLIQNEWWEKGEISKDKAKVYHRKVYEKALDTFSKYRQILVLAGLRRTGKTTIMYQIIENLIERGIDPKKILYFSFDKKIEDILEILKSYGRITKINWRKEKIFLFLDEIHKLRDWSSKIKIIYDSLPNIKMCISGSASLTMESEVIDNLAGRYFKIEVKPLSLQEYAELYYGKSINDYDLYKTELESVFQDYIRKPFPELVRIEDREKICEYIKSIIVEKILGSDIPIVFRNVRVDLLITLAEIFFRSPGMIMNLDEMSKKFHIHKMTLKEHIYYLEFGKMIRLVRNFRPSILSQSRKMPKIYPLHPCFSFAYFADVEKGRIYENLVMNALDLTNYFRENKLEVDFIKRNGDILPIEVKSKRNIEADDIKNLVKFGKRFNVKKAILISEEEERNISVNGIDINIVPIIKILF